MTVNPASIHDMWLFQDILARATQKLFEDSDDEDVKRLRAHRRRGLLHVIDGLVTENPWSFLSGSQMLADTMPITPATIAATPAGDAIGLQNFNDTKETISQ